MSDGTGECSKAEQAESPRELADRLRETEALLAIASAISSTRDFQEALRRVCRELARLIGAETASVHLLDRSSGLLRPFAGYHLPKEHLPILSTAPLRLKDQGFYLPLWKEKRPVYSDDVPHDSRFSDELFRLIPHQSGLLLPLVLDDEVEGAFYLVWWTARRRFTERELALMDTVRGQATLLLRNTRLFEQADHDRRRLVALYEVGRRLVGAHLTEEVLSLIVNESAQLLGAEAAGLRLLEGDDLVVGARTKSAVGIMASPRLKVGVGLSGLVVTSGEPLAVEDISQSSLLDPDDRSTMVGAGFLGFLGVPLRPKDRIIGVLNVYTRSRRRFSPEDISVLSAFADQASLAIEKARLYQESVDRVKDLEEALARVRQLQGLLPICAWCKKVRRDQNYWQSVESYVTEHTDARFSHGICPECQGKLVTRRDANG